MSSVSNSDKYRVVYKNYKDKQLKSLMLFYFILEHNRLVLVKKGLSEFLAKMS